jgi:RimJ/RimL family protein N-acetyltransferase
LDDFPDILAYSQDEEWGRWTPDPKPYTRRFGEEFVARKVLAQWETAPRFSIILDGKVVGGIGLEKVWAKTDLRNLRSSRVMEKLGMTHEAHLRSHILIEGVRQDEVHYGVLREEYECQG